MINLFRFDLLFGCWTKKGVRLLCLPYLFSRGSIRFEQRSSEFIGLFICSTQYLADGKHCFHKKSDFSPVVLITCVYVRRVSPRRVCYLCWLSQKRSLGSRRLDYQCLTKTRRVLSR